MSQDHGDDGAQPRTLYGRIAARLRADIVQQRLPAHSKIPAEVTLAERYEVSRGTIIKALDVLVQQGVVYRRRPQGTFVASDTTEGTTENARPAPRPQSHPPVIGMIVPYLPESFVGSIVLGVETVTRAAGYGLIFAHSESDWALEQYHVNQMLRGEAAGILIFPGNHAVKWHDGHLTSATEGARAEMLRGLQRDAIPFVLIDRYVPEIDCDYVVSDDQMAGYAATQHLVDLGHRRISFISTAPQVTSTAHRCAGYRRCLHEHDLPVDETLVLHRLRQTSPVSMPAGLPLLSVGHADRALLGSFLRDGDRPHAIVASNDYVALRVLQAADDAGLRVPDDVAVVCCGGGDIGAHARIPLTSIVQPAVDLGRQAAHILLDRIAGRSSVIRRTVLPVSMVVRRSCGAATRETPSALPQEMS